MEHKKQYDKPLTDEQKLVIKEIMKNNIYATIVKVSSSGMTRHMKFFQVRKAHKWYYLWTHYIKDVTDTIAELRGVKMKDGCAVVGWVGMDMIFATLYYALPYKERNSWTQNYKQL